MKYVDGVLVYVGHTTLTIDQRLQKHLQDAKRNPSDAFLSTWQKLVIQV
jgi:Uri superfamily endonuclease